MKDVHRTALGEQTPGLWLNASAVQAELYGPRIEDLSHRTGFGLDIFLGFLTAAVFGGLMAPLGMRILARFGVAVAVAAVLGSLLFPLLEIVWVSWVGMLISGMAWDVVVDLVFDHSDGPATPAGGGGAPAQPA
jgi:hypothetical protein